MMVFNLRMKGPQLEFPLALVPSSLLGGSGSLVSQLLVPPQVLSMTRNKVCVILSFL